MRLLVVALMVCAVSVIASAEPNATLRVGDVAPGFSLPYATKDSIADENLTLASLVSKNNVVLAFYPADWSGGCTREVCTLRDNFTALASLKADVVGISGDYVFSHYEWAKHHELPFKLASDHDHMVARQYGSYNEASGHDKRTVFVVDKAGKIGYMDLRYDVRDSVSFNRLKDSLKQLR
jgi:peroxiredoxin